MLKQHKRLVAISLYLTDMVVTIASFFLAYLVRSHDIFHFERRLYPVNEYFWLLLVVLPVWSILLYRFKAYKSYRTAFISTEFLALGQSVLLGGLIIGTFAFALKSFYLSRALIAVFILINLMALSLGRLLIRAFSWFVRKRGYNYRNVVIIGTDKWSREMAAAIEENRYWGLNLIGFITENLEESQCETGGHRIIGNIKEIQDIINREIIDEVIFALPRNRFEQLEDVFLMLEAHGINARIAINFFPHVIAKAHLDEIGNIPLLTFTTTPSNLLMLAIKRIFDVVASTILLILASPVMTAAAIAVKAGSPGPVFFKQKRCGLQGRIFTLYKFRSMVADAEERKKALESLNEMGGPVFKIKNDPRVTSFGRFIRKTSIDELPQLWNVLMGDMSIVGPRPPVPEEVAKYERWQRRRLSMRPGITCLWQISGRSEIKDFDEWVKLDLQYIDRWSLGLDLKIVLKTFPAVLFRTGAA